MKRAIIALALVACFCVPASAGPLRRAAKGVGKAAKVLTAPVRVAKRLFGGCG